MHFFALSAGLLCLAIWVYPLTAHGRFWSVAGSRASVKRLGEIDGAIAVVIPARDEADVIGSTVESLLRQSCARSIHIFVVDDHSSDGTAQAARDAACNSERSEALDVITGSALPLGWTGKLWAMEQGIQQAMSLSPKFLLLTDADIQHSPDNVATQVAIAEAGNYDLASFMVKLHCQTCAERALIPPFVFFFFLLYPPAWIRDSRRKAAGAAGGCMLIRPAALERAGGMAAIRNQIIDDCALARAVKKSGGGVWLGVTPDACSTRVLWDLQRDREDDCSHRLQSVATFGMAAARCATWTDDYLPASAGPATKRQPDVGCLGSSMLAADVFRVSSDGSLLRPEPRMG